MYCRTKTHDDEIKRQQTWNNLECRTVSPMITIKEKDLILSLRTFRTLINNPDGEIKTIRYPINKLASTQMGTEIQVQIDTIIKTDQVTLGTTDPTTVSKLSTTSVLHQRTQTLNTIKTSPRATTYLHPIQFNSLMIRNKCSKHLIRFLSFELLKSSRPDEEITSNQVFI